jgi:hypothetical protein
MSAGLTTTPISSDARDSDMVFLVVVQAVSYPLKLIGVYFVGCWIGARCIKRGVVATISAVVLGYTLSLLIEFWATDVTHLEEFWYRYGDLRKVGRCHSPGLPHEPAAVASSAERCPAEAAAVDLPRDCESARLEN